MNKRFQNQMNTTKIIKLLFSTLFLLSTMSNAQNLTISNTGLTSSPGTWSLSGSTLTVTGTANIRASVIVNALANGNLTVVGNTNNFAVTISEAITATGNNTLTVGSATNTGTITFNAVTSFAGPVTLYGGSINMDQNMTCTSSGSPILLQSTGAIDIAASRTVQSNSGNITLRSNSGGTVLSNASSIILNSSSSLLSQGGNITLGGNFTGAQGTGLYATSGNAPAILISGGTISAAGGNIKLYGKCNVFYDDGIRLTGTINTTGTGTIELYGEAYGGLTGSDTYFGGVTFGTANTTVSTENGNLTIEGILTNTNSSSASGLNFYRVAGGNGSLSIQLLSKTGNIQVSGRKAPSAASYGIGQCSQGDVYIGSPKDNSWTATGNIIMSLSSFDLAASTGIIFKTIGALNVEPYDASFNSSLTFPFTNNSSISGVSAFTMGKASNTANITIGAPGISVAGPITLYGGALSLGANITSTAGGEIALYSDAALAGLSSARSMTTTGAFRYLPQGTSFSSTVTFPITNLSLVNITELQLGKSGNTAGITIGSSATIAGPISIYGGYVNINGNLTSSATGDIFIKGIAGTNPSIWVQSGKTITKSGGTGTLTMQGHGRVSNSGSITTSGTGVLNVIFWSDFDNSNNDGGVSQFGTVSTNGGHVWLGGSNSNGGSYTWNGLTVGDGPSIGTSGFNGNALDIQGHITTSGGDLLVWAGNGSGGGTDGIVTNAGWELNVSDGDVVFITPSVLGSGPSLLLRQNGGTFTLVPNGTSFPVALNWSPSDTVYSGMVNWNFPDEFNYLWIENPTTLTNLTVGRYDGMSSGGNPVVLLNTSNININLPTTIAGSMSFYGGALALNSNLTTTNATTGNITLSGTTISGTGNIALASGRNATLNVSATSTYDGVISGTDSALTKSGSGKLMLTKDQTFSGATTITAGDLQVGTGGSVSQASSGTISSTTAVAVASGSKLILTPNENIVFAAPISGAGGVEIKGASGRYLNTWLTGTPTLFATNTTVLEALTRITGGLMDGASITGSAACGAYQKSFSAATNTATLQLQVYNGANPTYYTKCVFVKLSQSGSNVMIQANTSIYSSGAGYKSGNVLGTNIATGGTSMALATSAASSGYGIAEVYMSGKVNFTGNLNYSGNTVLSNTVTSVSNSTNISSYTSKGTQEITDASTGFPPASAVINNGLVIFNRANPLTIASNMEGTEEVLQVGAAITLTGANTHSGITTIDLNKSLLIGNGSTSGSITGNIINYGSLTFNRSDNSTYPGIISGSGSLTKLGEGSHTLTGLNTYTGATTISAGKLILERNVPATSSSSFSGIGHLVIQPSSASFTNAMTYPISGFTVASTIGGLTIGKSGNAANISLNSATSIAGPIEVYAGTITLNAGLTATNNGAISFYSDNAIAGLTASRTINAAGSFNYIPQSNSFLAAVIYPITNLNLTSSGLLIGKSTNTAAITFATATSIAGPITAYGGTITLDANLTTTNNGSISLYTDNALGGLSTARTLTAAGAFKYIPRATTFTADVTYPITNLTATSTGLTIGKTTNDKNITINADFTGGAGIELYGNNVNINANLKTTSGGAMYLKGITTIAAGKYIESNGNFTHDGNLNFKSDATGTAAFGALGGTFTTVSGSATTERYIPSKRAWRLLTAPLKGASNTTVPNQWQGVNGEGLLLFSPATYQSQTMTGYTLGGGMPNIWKYNNGWQTIPNLTNENLFTATGTKGFLVFATGASDSNNTASGEAATTLRPQGQLITGTVPNSIIGNQYNLVANPYASALNTEAMVQANSGSKVWMIDPTLGTVGGYFTYDGTNWAPTTPSATDKNIQSGQAFFVRTAGNSTFTITESDKVSGSSTSWFSRTTDTSADKIRVLLYKENNSIWQLADGILAVNSASGNNAIDDADTQKMSNFNENILFRNGSSNLAIEYRELPTVDTTQPMRLTGTTVLPYQLRVKTESYTNADLLPFIEDTVTGTTTAIPVDGSEIVIPFTGIAANTTNPDTRFRISYQTNLSTNNPNLLVVAAYPNPVSTEVFTVALKDNSTPASYTLTNLLGQEVQAGNLMLLNNPVPVSALEEGIYILKVVQQEKSFTTKLIIKKSQY